MISRINKTLTAPIIDVKNIIDDQDIQTENLVAAYRVSIVKPNIKSNGRNNHQSFIIL